ncbi:MAG: hypothetical protein AAFV77_02405 [Planctomycetota bacterium]
MSKFADHLATIAGTAAAIAALPAVANAQVASNGITIVIEDTELLPGESTKIRMEAYFGPLDYAVAGIATWLFSSAGAQGLSDPLVISPMDGPGTTPGDIGDTGVRGILAGQLNFPATAGIYADDSNPISFWEVTYTAPIDVAAPFDVLLESRTSRFDVYVERSSSQSESRLDDFAEGEGVIRVIPAPAGALVLAAALGMGARRRRDA